jgi:hypothetical protein
MPYVAAKCRVEGTTSRLTTTQGDNVELCRENVAVNLGGYFGLQSETELATYSFDCLQYIQSRNFPDTVSNINEFQRDAALSSLHFTYFTAGSLYMFRVLFVPIIRST